MIGGFIRDWVIGEEVEVSVSAGFFDPDGPFPTPLPRSHIEPSLTRVARRRPCLARGRLFDLQPRPVDVLEVPARPICRAPSPTGRESQIHHRFDNDSAKIVLDEWPTKGCVGGMTLDGVGQCVVSIGSLVHRLIVRGSVL